jgi:predicted RNase H-like HicB family nuclease
MLVAQASSLCKRTGKMSVPPKPKALEKFLIVIEQDTGNYSAYCPDLPGCIATGKTTEEVKQHMAEAIKMHLEGMREDNIPIPVVKSQAEYISLEL